MKEALERKDKQHEKDIKGLTLDGESKRTALKDLHGLALQAEKDKIDALAAQHAIDLAKEKEKLVALGREHEHQGMELQRA